MSEIKLRYRPGSVFEPQQQLLELLKETKEVLKLVEWGSRCMDYEDSCPCCRYNAPDNSCYTGDGTHSEDCQLSKLIYKINSLLNGQERS
jgi:hypothetical protein